MALIKKEERALRRALEKPEVATHIVRKKAAWRNPNPSEEVLYTWSRHKIGSMLLQRLLRKPLSELILLLEVEDEKGIQRNS